MLIKEGLLVSVAMLHSLKSSQSASGNSVNKSKNSKAEFSVPKALPVDNSSSDAVRDEFKAVLRQRGLALTVETFQVNIGGRWYLQFEGRARPQFTPKYDLNLTAFTCDVIDLGSKSWIVVGNATGNRTDGLAINIPFNVEYNSASDTLLWNAGQLKTTIAGVSSPTSPVQTRADITVPKIVLVFRQRVEFQSGYRMLESSYLSI